MTHKLNSILALAVVGAIAAGVAYGGETEGPWRRMFLIHGYGSHDHNLNFQGGRNAVVVVSGDGDSDLDLEVYDQNNNLVCSDDDNSDLAVCRWTPKYSADYRLRVENIGQTANRYLLRTN
jgi:hypothetical protein